MMDESLSGLERAYRADANNLELLGTLSRARARMSWCFQGRPISEWLEALRDKEWHVRGKAVWRLSQIGAEAEFAVPALVELFDKEQSTTVQGLILSALGNIACQAAAPLLIQAGETAPMGLRWIAFQALAKLGPGAKIALPHLRRFFARPVPGSLFASAVEAVVAIAPEESVAILGGFLKSEFVDYQMRAVTQLGELGEIARPLLPALEELANTKSSWVARKAEEAADKIKGYEVSRQRGRRDPQTQR
jgi:HEAT repeat protein